MRYTYHYKFSHLSTQIFHHGDVAFIASQNAPVMTSYLGPSSWMDTLYLNVALRMNLYNMRHYLRGISLSYNLLHHAAPHYGRFIDTPPSRSNPMLI